MHPFPKFETVDVFPHEQWRLHCLISGIRFELVSFQSNRFQNVLKIRSEVYKSELASYPDSVDEYSEHYLAIQNGFPLAALRVTRCTAGALDCEEFYPSLMLKNFAKQIGSASRFVALPSAQVEFRIPRLIVEAAWLDQLSRGIRLDVINVHERGIKYYGKLGYELVADSFFVHPKWNTPSHIMLLPATANRISPIQRVFDGIVNPIEMATLQDSVKIASWKNFRPNRNEIMANRKHLVQPS